MEHSDTPRCSALFLSAFFDELIRYGVRDVVVSPGSRSTPLSMVAYESDLRLHVDVDERGAAFFALGLAKASGRPVCVICTSGTAVANYYPAILEAESSRIPLIVLTGDRPPRLQNLGAPQTCDQLDIFGRHVRHFQQMPLPGASVQEIAFARQMALVAFSRSVGTQAAENDRGEAWYGCISNAGPVHFNFPLDEPLKPDLHVEGLFSCGRRATTDRSPLVFATSYPDAQAIASLESLIKERRTLVLCGEGSFSNQAEAQMLLAWAHAYQLPLLADPLSNLRSFSNPLIIDNYDNLFNDDSCSEIDLVIRFGRYPVSKACFSALAVHRPVQIVVDSFETRDFNATTDLLVSSTPAAFIASCMHDVIGVIAEEKSDSKNDDASTEGKRVRSKIDKGAVQGIVATEKQKAFAQQWIERNDREAERIKGVRQIEQDFEGAFVHRLFDIVPESSCVFSASSLAIRMVDTFYLKNDRKLTLLCNRGLNGIDGCLSSAIGAAHCFEQTTFVTGDLALIHDLNALSMQRELMVNHKEGDIPSLIVVVLNNEGGGIFETLPQQSEEPYFKRLFLTPQNVDFSYIARGFDIPFVRAQTVDDMEAAYQDFRGKPGIHLIEVPLSTKDIKDRYGDFLA